jgi:2-polyprenyl-6-hydroxyphenyl methylase/3-demethylubiquinone-9 3-methyltransferase
MPIDNDVYDREGAGWWDENSPLNILHGSLTPGRFAYFQEVLTDRLHLAPEGLRALDIGCGGGFLAEEFARRGSRVVGVDPSQVSIDTARRHAAATGLDIDYRVGTGEHLPVPDAEFDVAYCCDVLEHVTDVDAVLRETARALRANGVFFFDTINRTRASRLLAIKVMQEWRWTRFVDATVHDWDMFITPEELEAALHRTSLRLVEVVGLGPRTNRLAAIIHFIRANRGMISVGELSRRLDIGRVKTLDVSYMGYARNS